jgi:hypothetical protein
MAQVELAEVLLRRGTPSEQTEARQLLREAAGTAARLGMPVLERRASDRLTTSSHGNGGMLPRLEPDGEDWALVLGSRRVRLRQSKGLAQLAVLLANPGQEITAAELAGAPESSPPVLTPVLDETARRAYRRRLADLDETLANAAARTGPERLQALQAERDALVKELMRASGLGGRPRAFVDATERARVNVTRTIRQALDRILQIDPDIGVHLAAAVRTGTRCVYDPTTAPRPWVRRSERDRSLPSNA